MDAIGTAWYIDVMEKLLELADEWAEENAHPTDQEWSITACVVAETAMIDLVVGGPQGWEDDFDQMREVLHPLLDRDVRDAD